MSVSLTSLAKQVTFLEEKVEKLQALLPEQPKPSRFVDNNDGTVTDKETNLVWMKQDDGKRRSWKEAMEYCDKNEAKLPGAGWRLPTVKELISLIDYERYNPSIDPVFTDTKSASYWSSTPHAGNPGDAWVVGFFIGNEYWNKSYGYFVRPVRQNS